MRAIAAPIGTFFLGFLELVVAIILYFAGSDKAERG
jgi:hypothetical protein